jgi:hypothetical protein
VLAVIYVVKTIEIFHFSFLICHCNPRSWCAWNQLV